MTVDPTLEEQRNGWDAKKLTKYLSERDTAIKDKILFSKPAKPNKANSKYSPFKWRR